MRNGAPTRRDVLAGAACALASGRLWALEEGEELVAFSGYAPGYRVDLQSKNPRLKSFDLRRLTSWTRPDPEFYEFHQGSAPAVDGGKWRLRVGGAVERPAEFSLEDLQRRPDHRDAAVTLECSGNSGTPQLMNGLVGNAVWSGVSLVSILKECGLKAEAREVVFLGLDAEKERKWQTGNQEYTSPYGRSIFVQDALDPGPMLALKMNGEPLSPAHGFPLRLILPGWYGMAHVKWLSRIEVLDRRYEGRQMARNYQSLWALATPEGDIWLDTSIARTRLKSVIARVTRRRAENRFEYKISGAAWGGAARIDRVEVRVDDGTWRGARIDHRGDRFAWLLWSYDWSDVTPGRHTLVSRAINADGEVQPTGEELREKLASHREDHSQWPRVLTIE